MINIFIGYDNKEKVAYDVLSYSILKNSSEPVAITPVNLQNVKKYFDRPKNNLSSTEFSFSRFIVPYLMEYSGWAIFMDCDMLITEDINRLWSLRDNRYAVQVCKHDYVPRSETKFLNQTQTKYEKKNWSSLMIMNCEKCTALTRDYVHEASGLELHQFKWLESDDEIGGLPLEWNWLVDEYPTIDNVYNVHFTLGGPWFETYSNSPYSDLWREYYHETTQINL
jgi:lipopolysaccharide biosynthesis glycosyltransferase